MPPFVLRPLSIPSKPRLVEKHIKCFHGLPRSTELLLLALILFLAFGAAGQNLEQDFATPPPSSRPWVNWFWLDGNITTQGITADLEAMQRVGLGGALLMDVTQQIPAGPVRFGAPQWYAMFHHAAGEALRLGLDLSMNNAPGWSGSGGPWITPDLAMQKLVWSKTNFTGPLHFSGTLPVPPVALGSYHDVAVLAFPTLVGDGAPVPGFSPRLTSSSPGVFDGSALLDDNPATVATLPLASPTKPQFLQAEFREPFFAAHLELTGADPAQTFAGILQVSKDGRTFLPVREVRSRRGDLSVDFEPVSSRYFRVLITQAAAPSNRLAFSSFELTPSFRIELAQAKAGLGRWSTVPPSPANVPSYALLSPESAIDLTAKTQGDGRLTFDVPKGRWTVFRFGYTPTGKVNHPVAKEASGLECDKLSREAIEFHFNAFLGRLVTNNPGRSSNGFVGTHVDSWENGYQNWTPGFAAEFRARRGYDLTPYLPAFSGRIVGSPEISERFLWDIRRTIADLWAQNYAGRLATLSHEHGLQLSIEAYANGPFDQLLYAGEADIPMAEFWAETDDNSRLQTSRSMASAAHTCGKRVIAAEAFTSYPRDAKWQNHPFTLKPLADAAFCEGINRIVFHRYAHQPWLDLQPGMTMGQWGVHYERTETWWEQSRPWHEYLARCQFLLQQGLVVADLCYLLEEGAYNDPPTRDKLDAPPPPGHNFDFISPDALLTRVNVRDGSLLLPDGMSYRVLILPATNTMTPPLLRKIKDLVNAGATVVGPHPIVSPSLTDYPECDRQIKDLAVELWGDCDGKNIREHAFGKGSIHWGDSLSEVLASLKIAPDFRQNPPVSGQPLKTIHRRISGGDFYFVANSNLFPVIADCTFRVSGRQPEIWQPDTGKISRPASWIDNASTTTLRLKFDPAGSAFVVFREAPSPLLPLTVAVQGAKQDVSAGLTLDTNGVPQLVVDHSGVWVVQGPSGKVTPLEAPSLPPAKTVSGSWDLLFPPNRGAPRQVTLPRLISWTQHSDPGVKYFSGTATYRKTIGVTPELLRENVKVYLDLGKVAVIAGVKVNQREMGILWKPPFRLEVTSALRAGENQLEIEVVNLWPNRLIGDEQLPDDCRWLPAEADYGCALKEWPQWLTENRPRVSGRLTFATWKHWVKDSPLLESGLLGPVRLTTESITAP